ncbi:MAG: hypothetical protein GWM90_24765 [Gemmatimonadetes bacterium]|nr:hypothetical protein [Gemmatimonadota bacterium]NIQ57993.1 hypothetical protein [Gemmatimonadota bacterium]NIU78173.1 hypothetical protein [Gammaproteobacteria bacterium]NIX47169.1 hypothetical protein [Gemmatimonadota bacterium]NIY11550.1 hypothetical protein [Gemmatimonadota bacterium]
MAARVDEGPEQARRLGVAVEDGLGLALGHFRLRVVTGRRGGGVAPFPDVDEEAASPVGVVAQTHRRRLQLELTAGRVEVDVPEDLQRPALVGDGQVRGLGGEAIEDVAAGDLEPDRAHLGHR